MGYCKHKRRLTNGNCSPPCSGGSASIRLGRLRLPRLIPAHFAVAGLASQALIRNRKTSVTLNVMRHICSGKYKEIMNYI